MLPARSLRARLSIVMVQVVVRRRESAGHAQRPAAERIAMVEADVGTRRAIEVGHHLQHSPFDDRADAELDRFKTAFASGNIEHMAV